MAGVTLPDQSFAPGPAASACWDTPLQHTWGEPAPPAAPRMAPNILPSGIARGALGEGFFVLVASPG